MARESEDSFVRGLESSIAVEDPITPKEEISLDIRRITRGVGVTMLIFTGITSLLYTDQPHKLAPEQLLMSSEGWLAAVGALGLSLTAYSCIPDRWLERAGNFMDTKKEALSSLLNPQAHLKDLKGVGVDLAVTAAVAGSLKLLSDGMAQGNDIMMASGMVSTALSGFAALCNDAYRGAELY